jgi:xylulokinase
LPQGFVLAADLGGSSFRVALLARDGRIAALSAAPQAQRATEAEPDAWWAAFRDGAAAVARAAPEAFGQVVAVAVTAFTRGLVLADATGAPLRPALLWNDTRGAAALPAARAALGAAAEARHLSASHPLPRLIWLREAEPERFARARFVLEPKDELNRRLTGRVASDSISAARLAASAAALPQPLLPPLLRPHETLAPVQPGLEPPLDALAGVPVLAMSHDSWAAVLGLGALRAGAAYAISGTTEVLGLLGTHAAQARGLLDVEWDGLWQLGGPSEHGADALAWARAAGLDAAPADAPVPVLFLPTLAGERVPHLDPSLRGAFLGLRRGDGAPEMLRAVMQGVAFRNRGVLEAAEAAMGFRAPRLHLGGGGATAPWAQLRADVLGREVVVPATPEPGLLGCAIAGFAAAEARPLAALAAELARDGAVFAPDPARHAALTRLHTLFVAAEAAVAPLSRALAALG